MVYEDAPPEEERDRLLLLFPSATMPGLDWEGVDGEQDEQDAGIDGTGFVFIGMDPGVKFKVVFDAEFDLDCLEF